MNFDKCPICKFPNIWSKLWYKLKGNWYITNRVNKHCAINDIHFSNYSSEEYIQKHTVIRTDKYVIVDFGYENISYRQRASQGFLYKEMPIKIDYINFNETDLIKQIELYEFYS